MTIALDGENAWEYYPRDGRDFLHYLYEGLAGDPGFAASPSASSSTAIRPTRPLALAAHRLLDRRRPVHLERRPGPHAAWDLLHDARDHVAAARAACTGEAEAPSATGTGPTPAGTGTTAGDLDEAWRHILVAEGSDWFWWFGEHQHSGIDYVWDLELPAASAGGLPAGGEPRPRGAVCTPILTRAPVDEPTAPSGRFTPIIDGRLTSADEWSAAGVRRPPRGGVMVPGEARLVDELRFGTDGERLFLLVVPGPRGFGDRRGRGRLLRPSGAGRARSRL